jgi:hypothetical protein
MQKPLVYVKYSRTGNAQWTHLNDIKIGDKSVQEILETLDKMTAYCEQITEANKQIATEYLQLKETVVEIMTVDTTKYLNCKLNEQGYVIDIEPIDLVIKQGELPADLHEQCYQIKDGELVLDEVKKSAVHSLI